MSSQIITKANLKKIHDVACASWKTKLENYANRQPFDTEVELTQPEIDEMYAASDANQIKVLNKFFTKPENIMDRVKTYLDACQVLGIPSEGRSAYERLCIFLKVLNEGWFPNFENENENKFWNYFYMKNGVFSYYYTGCNSSSLNVPSALYLKNRELAEYAAKVAYKEYKEVYLERL